jgi:hypothetical protein
MNLKDIRYVRFNSLARHLLGLFYRAGGAYPMVRSSAGLRMRYDLTLTFRYSRSLGY